MSPDPQQFVKFPVNVLEWRRHLSATKWTVLSVIHDKVARWDKESDAVSNSQIAAETTLSESSIRRAIAEMNTTDGPIDVVTLGTRGIPVYRVRPCDRCQPDTPVNLTPLSPIGCQPDTPPTTIGVTATKRARKASLSAESGEQGAEVLVGTTATSKSTGEENGPVEETNPVKVDRASVVLEGPPTCKALLFVNPKTGRTWAIGQDVDCLSYELGVTKGEAEAIMADGNGMGAASILAILKANWGRIKTKDNRVGHIRTIIWNQAPTRANKQAEPTKQTPPPVPPAPLPTGKRTSARMDEEVLAGFAKLGTGNYSLAELGQAIALGQSEKGRAALCQHLNDMKLRNRIALDGAGLYSGCSP
jgi:hypothetical protein